jgi:hypothetical protein
MPSLGDVANEIKAILEDVKTNTSTIKSHTLSIKNDTASIKTNTDTIIVGLGQIDTHIKAGFTNLSQGMQILILLGLQHNQLLVENNKQNETIICWLTNIANTLCDIKHNTDKEVKLQTDISATLHHIDDINELVNAPQAMAVANNYELKKATEACCPPKPEPLKPCFEACESPRPIDIKPVKPEWNPIKYDDGKIS